MSKAKYRVTTQNIDYPPDKHAGPGDLVDDLPGNDIEWLLSSGAIEPEKAQAEREAAQAAIDAEAAKVEQERIEAEAQAAMDLQAAEAAQAEADAALAETPVALPAEPVVTPDPDPPVEPLPAADEVTE